MSGEERAASGEGVMLARVFEDLRGIREQQHRGSKQLEQVTSVLLGLTDQVRRMDRHLENMDKRLRKVGRRIGK